MAIDRQGDQNSVSRFSISPDVAERFGFRLTGETDFRQAPKDLLGIATTPLASAKPMINDHVVDISLSFFTHRWDPLIFPLHTTHSHREARRVFSRDDGRSKNSTTALLYDEKGTQERERHTERGMEICRYRYAFW